MKANKKLAKKISIFLVAVLLLALSITAVMVSASETIEVVGEMTEIKAAFADYLMQDTVRADDGGYVGDYQYTAYYDTSKGAIKTGYEGTPIVIYTINHPEIERIGTDSNTTIIQSMLDRGYIVIVLDYLNNSKAVSPAIENSTQAFRTNLRNGKVLTSSAFPSGSYHENFLAPSGYNVLLNQVFWEIDKHSTEGTLDKIVENWNSDFRATKGSKLVLWVHEDGTRKAVQKDLEGNDPKWYNASGKEDANGTYTYIKYTKAETITDCVDPDGSFIDMNLYINVVYPTNPKNEVPVMSLANSSGYPTTSVTGADLRPHSNGFLYNGYANVVFDYLWVPMARNASWGYYDGSQGITQDHMNYAVMMYNDKLVNTAAMRYLRYISLSGGTKFNFDLDKFGVYGNSKGGWFSFLGEEIVQTALVDAKAYAATADLENAISLALEALVPDRYYNGHHGETRYSVGAVSFTADGFTVKAGEKQPWLTYEGVEIISGCQLTNACNGSQEEDITKGHSPIFISGNMADTYNAAYSYSVNIYNICRELNIPLLHFEVPIGHTLTSGPDMNYNVDTYDAYFRYINYYLKNSAISVAYVSPMTNAGGVKVTDKITIGFAGAANLSEVEKITLAAGGATVSGSWEASFGGTVWTFTPDALKGGTEYTLTIPADFAGDNGTKIGAQYTTSFITEFDIATEAIASGNYYTLTAPAMTSGNSFAFRFLVTNDAANTAELYAVDSVGASTGTLLGKVNLRGQGSYEIDVTDYVAANSGKEITLLLTGAKDAGVISVMNETFDSAKPSSVASKATVTAGATIDGEKALKVVVSGKTEKGVSVYYDNVTQIFTQKNITGTHNTTYDNVGRRFTVSFDVYDTTTRVVQVKFNWMTKRTEYGTIDYNHVIFNVKTTANEWTHVEFTYEVYESDYGYPAASNNQSLSVYASPSGDTNAPLYFNDLIVTETVTDINVGGAYIAEKNDGTGAYTAPVSDTPFVIYNGSTKVGEYATWAEAFANYKSGYTLKLQRDYTLTDADITDKIGTFSNVNIDLGTYTITCANTKNSLLWAKATTTTSTVVNITGGAIRLGRTALVSYENSTKAGSGKVFNINLAGTYIGFAENAWATELISDVDTTTDVNVNSNIKLMGCTLDFDDASHAKDASVIFNTPVTASLKLNYTVIGGSINLSSQRWITTVENAKITEFEADSNGNYTTLIMPLSITESVKGSYLTVDGYASYVKESVINNMVTYTLESGDNSTRYGIITDTYADVDKYPVILFKDGVLVSAHTSIADAITAAKNVLGDAKYESDQAEILLRKSIENAVEPTYGNTAGTLVIDLGGHTLKRSKVVINAVVTSSTPMFETNVIFMNGKLETTASPIGVTHCLYTTTNVKTYNITFDNVTFALSNGATAVGNAFWTIWQNGHATIIDTNLNLINCTFDLTNKPAKTGNLFTLNTTQAECDVIVEGGTVIGGGSGINLFATDSNDSVLLTKDSDGNYLSYTAVNGSTPVEDNFFCDDGTYRNFQSTDNGYELLENDLLTPYGAITSKYEDANTYPFVVFNEKGGLIGGYKYLYGNNGNSSAWGAAKEYVKSNKFDVNTGKFTVNTYKAYIYMRRDYTFQMVTKDGKQVSEYTDNIAQVRGEITLDLGGNTLYQDANSTQAIFQATSKRWETVTNANGETVNYNFPSTYNVKNGSIRVNTLSVIKHSANDSSNAHKVFTFNFDNVIFGLAEGAKTTSLLTSYGGSNYAAGLKINLNGCTFDLNTVKPTAAITLIDANHSKSNIDVDITIKGTKFLADDLSNIKFSGTKASNVSLKFEADEYGHFATLETLSANTPNTTYFASDDGNMYFVEHVVDGTKSIYYLDNLTTPYGTVSASTITSNPGYLSAVDYPFFIFKDGSFNKVATTFKNAVTAAKDLGKATTDSKDKTIEILMRRDYDVTKATADNGNNFNTARRTIVVDLSGYTLKAVDTYIIDIYINYNTTSILNYESSILFKNGTFTNGRSDFTSIGLGHTNAAASGYSRKKINFSFENITFQSGAKPIMEDFGHAAATGLEIDVNCTNCTFDFTNSPSGLVMFKLKTTKTNVISNVKLYSCTIVAENASNYSIYSVSTEDSALVGRTDNGQYLTVKQLSTSATPTLTFTSINGKALSFGKDITEGSYTYYILGEAIKTAYGYIPFTYQSTEDYPFAVFDKNGNFLGADDTLLDKTSAYDNDGAYNTAKGHLVANVWNGSSYGADPRSAIILLRRDYAMDAAEQYNNIAQAQGLITIDLNGYTLTAPKDRAMFGSTIKPWTGSGDAAVFPTDIAFIGGNIVLQNAPLVQFDAWTGDNSRPDNYVAEKKFTYSFTDINFSVIGTATDLAASFKASSTPNAIGYTYMTFTGCVFDLSKAKSTITLFNLGNDKIHNTVTVAGGEIIAVGKTYNISKATTNNSGALVFTKTNAGNYTALTLALGTAAPETEYALASGTGIFVKISETNSTVTYRLRPTELADINYTPKMSLTLDRDLIFNIYIPVKSLVKFTINDTVYADLANYSNLITTLDGENYYLVSIPVSAKDATDTIALTANIATAAGNANVKFNFNIVKYAYKVLESGSDEEKQLMLDVLAYVRSAYDYFNVTGNDYMIEAINEILGESYNENNAPAIEGTATAPTEGLSYATFILSATPTIRFYLPEGANAKDYTFFANGVSLKTEVGENENGVYVDIVVYAYRMCENITYKINGNEAGVFHIRSYYEWALAGNDAKLTDLVARFWKYAQSARAYRNSVIGG